MDIKRTIKNIGKVSYNVCNKWHLACERVLEAEMLTMPRVNVLSVMRSLLGMSIVEGFTHAPIVLLVMLSGSEILSKAVILYIMYRGLLHIATVRQMLKPLREKASTTVTSLFVKAGIVD